MADAPSSAVFLSYASQDAEAARRIAEALRAAGVEVWFDQNELVGGDAWDAKIRGQIASCALFVPVISAATQARLEGYFRIEWKLAAQRTHAMADEKAFLLPVVIDETRDADAKVPAEFRAVQWTRLPGGEGAVVEKFCARVKALLGGPDVARAFQPVGAPKQDTGWKARATKKRSPPVAVSRRLWLWSVGLGILALVGLAVWRPWLRQPAAVAPVAAAPAGVSTELARLRARVVPDKWQRADFEVIAAALNRLEQIEPENAEIWSLRSIIHSLQALRAFDRGTKPLEIGRSAANRALSISPEAPSGHLALGLHHLANMSRGGDPRACRAPLDRGLAAMAPDALTRWAELASYWLAYDFEAAEPRAQAWLKVEPQATYPAWVLEISAMMARRLPEMQRWGEIAAVGGDITGVRALTTLADGTYFMRADPAESRAILARVPAAGRALHRVVFSAWLFAMADRRWDEALQELAQVPEVFFTDGTYSGPKSLLAALAHQRAGRPEAAAVQLHEAERRLREQLATDAEHESHRIMLALVLAHLGRSAEARAELGLVEPLIRRRTPNNYWAYNVLSLMWAHAALGDHEDVAFWLRKVFVSKIVYPLTPAMVRIDPRFHPSSEAPVIQALLQEFAALDQPATVPAAVPEKSVAVLAFKSLSDDKANEYFSEGISEELLNVLGRVPGLRVAAPMSAFSFKGRNVSAQEIGQKLNVAYLVNGSVRREGPEIRVVARLSRAETDQQIWTEKFQGEAKNVFALQEEIAGKIAAALSLKLGAGSAAAKGSVNPEAFELYVQARRAWNQRNAVGYDRAEALLNQVLELEPKFARGHAALADVWLMRTQDTGPLIFSRREDPKFANIRAKAEYAVALDPESAEAHASLGSFFWLTWQFANAERELRRAIELSPGYASAHQWFSRLLSVQGRLDDAMAQLKLAAELDPLSSRILDNQMTVLRHAGRISEALSVGERALAIQPDNFQAMRSRVRTLVVIGRVEEGLALMAETPEDRTGVSIKVRLLAAAGRRAEAESLYAKVRDDIDLSVTLRITCELALDNREKALEALDSSRMSVTGIDQLFFDPLFDQLRSEVRFRSFLAQLGLTEAHDRAQAWRKAHPPEKPVAK